MDIVQLITDIDAFVWGPPMIVILLGSHLFLTFRTGFIQRKLPTAIKLSVTKDPDAPGDISQFGALCTALSATIGTGNIVGVATAILAGGPGAVLWMWLTGVFGMATTYSETFAAVKYRVKEDVYKRQVGDHDHGHAAPVQLAAHAHEALAPPRVEHGRRLVQYEDLRLHAEHAGDGHALLLAAGQGVRLVLLEAHEAHLLERVVHAPGQLGRLPVSYTHLAHQAGA